jgi:plastocyanin
MFSRVQRRILTGAIVALLCAAGLTAAVSANAHSRPANRSHPASKHKTVTVTLKGFAFNPMDITIAPGTTVKWIWEDGPHGDHNITPLKKKGSLLFKGASTRTKGTYSVKFTKAGTYYYECSVHPLTMQARIIVK